MEDGRQDFPYHRPENVQLNGVHLGNAFLSVPDGRVRIEAWFALE